MDSGYATASPRASTTTASLDPASPFPRESQQSFLRLSLENRLSSHTQSCYSCPDSQPSGHGTPEVHAANGALNHHNTFDPYPADDYLSDFYPQDHPPHLQETSTSSTIDHVDPQTYQPPHAAPSRCNLAATSSASQGSGLEPCEQCGATKLHHLASISRRTDVALFKEVVDSNLNSINKLDDNGNSCIHFAAGAGASLEQLKVLQHAGVNVTWPNISGQTLLHLLDPNLYGESLPAVLFWASQLGLSFFHRDCHGKTPLHHILGRHITLPMIQDLTPFLRDAGRSMTFLDRDGNTPYDVLWDKWQKANHGVDLPQLHPILIANRIPVIFRRLPSTDGTLDLHKIIDRSQNEEYCQDSRHQNVLHALAAFANNPHSSYMAPWDILQCLQERLKNSVNVGIDINQYNSDGLTPLHCFLNAAFDFNLEFACVVSECVKLLYLQYGANPLLQDRYGNNAWQYGLASCLQPNPL